MLLTLSLVLLCSCIHLVSGLDCSALQAPEKGSAEVLAELHRFVQDYGFSRPERSAVDETRPWRCGAPNYDTADLLYFQGRTQNHSSGSPEAAVENFVKNWEMEVSHLEFKDWTTVVHDKYRVSSNGAPFVDGVEAAKMGNYNTLMKGVVDKSLYASSNHTFESSHEVFRNAFKKGFAWELIEVLSGPPKVVFSWRHWATFDGTYRGRTGDGKLYELYGITAATLDATGKIAQVEVFYKPESFLRALQGELDSGALHRGAMIFGDGVPITAAEREGTCSAGRSTGSGCE